MTDTTSSTTSTSSTTTPGTTPAMRSTGISSLQSEHGTTTIADTVVSKIAALAAREVDGVAELGGAVSGALSGMVGRITGGGDAPRTAGVGVEVGQTQAAVDLTMKVLYPASIHEVADSVRQNVIDRIEGMTGLDVVEVNIAVVDLVFPGAEPEQPEQPEQPRRMSRVE
jgi:uncharacterized alkaline shock family protein YloU